MGYTSGNRSVTQIDGYTEEETIGQFQSNPNLLINGNFQVWQRGTSFTTSSYNADRWKTVWNGSGGTITTSRQSWPLGNSDIPGNSKYYFRVECTAPTSGSTYTTVQHKIEDVRTGANGPVTVSFYARGNTSFSLPIIMRQDFGSGGSASSYVNTAGPTCNITTSWQKFTATIYLPNIDGKILGIDGKESLHLLFESLPLNSTFTFDLADVKVEIGEYATPFTPRSYAEELALCQRYYCTGTAFTSLPNGPSYGSTTVGTSPVYFPTTMRAIPSVTESNISISTNGTWVNNSIGNVYTDKYETEMVTQSATTGYANKHANFAADAEL